MSTKHQSELAQVRSQLLSVVSRMTQPERVFFAEYAQNPAEPERAAKRAGHNRLLPEVVEDYLAKPLMVEAVRLLKREETLKFDITLDDIHHRVYELALTAEKETTRLAALQLLEKRMAVTDSRYVPGKAHLKTPQERTKVLVLEAQSKVVDGYAELLPDETDYSDVI